MTLTFITGANRGIGYETARQLTGLGHTVSIGARDPDRGKRAASELGARFVQIDVTNDTSVENALKTIDGAEGHLDLLINNAGIVPATAFGPDALQVFNTNPVGVVRVTQAAIPLLRRSANPVVVNVTSGQGSFWAVANPERIESHIATGVYAASKAAITMLTVQYAKAEHDAGAEPEIKFNAVDPGYTATDLIAGYGGGRPVEESVGVIVRLATIGSDGPTGTVQEDIGELPF